MTTKQLQANRLNALKSTGPRTAAGKAISSKNSLKHGFCVDDATLLEDPETRTKIEERFAEYFDFYQPRSPLERDCLEEIALCKVRLSILQRAENGILNNSRSAVLTDVNPDLDSHPPEDRRSVANMLLGAAWTHASEVLDSLSRQENRLANRLRRAEMRFDAMLAARRQESEESTPPALQNEPDSPITSTGPTPTGFVMAPQAVPRPPQMDPGPTVSLPATPLPPESGPSTPCLR